jgi:predicted nucleic acid-binding protein
MALNYTINAQIIDIRSDTPQKEDKFLIDTNAWYWYSYQNLKTSLVKNLPNEDQPRRYQIENYPEYITKADNNNSSLFYSGVSLAELAHNIESTERKIFSYSIRSKEYRHNYPAERAKVITEVNSAWNELKLAAQQVDICIDQVSTNAMLSSFKTHLVDGYDLILLQSMRKHGINQILTDDGDFATVPDIQVFTSNNTVIKAAKQQGKFLIR